MPPRRSTRKRPQNVPEPAPEPLKKKRKVKSETEPEENNKAKVKEETVGEEDAIAGKTTDSKQRKVRGRPKSESLKPKTEDETDQSAMPPDFKEEAEDEMKAKKEPKSKADKGKSKASVAQIGAAKPKSEGELSKQAVAEPEVEDEELPRSDKGKAKGKGRPKRKLEDEQPLPERMKSSHLLGAHISAAGGVENAVSNALKIGANAFSLFIRPKMSWAAKPLDPESISTFQSRMSSNDYKPLQVVPHGMYLTNLANPDPDKRQKSIEILVDEMNRCKELGCGLLNFHPGSSVGGCDKSQALRNVSNSINEILEHTQETTLLIENMAGAGNGVGGSFEELKVMLDGVKEELQDRVGICLDTCHAFASGYDLRAAESYEEVMNQFENVVGLKYLKAVHLNDSKEGLSSHKDRHANIGRGRLGLEAFYLIMNDQRFSGIPLILETPGGDDDSMYEVWKREIQALYMLQGLPADPESWSGVWKLLDEALRIKEEGVKRVDTKKAKTKINKANKAGAKKTRKAKDEDREDDEAASE